MLLSLFFDCPGGFICYLMSCFLGHEESCRPSADPHRLLGVMLNPMPRCTGATALAGHRPEKPSSSICYVTHQTSLNKHRAKDRITKNFNMATAGYYSLSGGPLLNIGSYVTALSQGPAQIPYLK